MNGNNSYKDRNSIPSKGETLFEEYCNKKGVNCIRLGFDQFKDPIPKFYEISCMLRNIPDYLVTSKDKNFLVMVKGTANIKKAEVTMIPQFLEWYATKEVPLYYAFCFEGESKPFFITPDRVIQLYQEGTDKQWNDGKIYRTLNIGN